MVMMSLLLTAGGLKCSRKIVSMFGVDQWGVDLSSWLIVL